ncbi:MAG: hypothetical protein WBW04_08695 [Nitrolancea sp.]
MVTALRIRGPFRGSSGYDHKVRELSRILVRRGVRVQLIDMPGWSSLRLTDGDRERFFETLTRPIDAPITVHCTMPDQVVIDHPSVQVNFTVFEANRIPRKWVELARDHALVIVPTESSRQAWIASGVPERQLRVCPQGVDPEIYGPDVRPLRLFTETGRSIQSFTTRFLNVSELGPRKNLAGLLRAWLLATRRDDDAILILKLGQSGLADPTDFTRKIREIEHETGKSFSHAAPVEMMLEVLGDRAMPRLYALATHYISMSHGEGWDHPMVESGASGLHLIAPDHSAYRAYLTPEIATLLPSRIVPASFEGSPGLQDLFEGADWWEPDQEAAVAAIRYAIDHPQQGPSPAQELLRTRFTWDHAADRFLSILDELSVAARH